jgi:hypothetical protein
MSENSNRPGAPPVEVESTDRWVAGKTKDELLADLRVYLARLRDNPHSIVDRLRVAAIQLRLGRDQEALIHYEGVLRGYVGEGQVMSAIALCRRILALYPNLPRIQRILAALYAHAPHGATGAPTPVTPIRSLEDQPTTTFVVGDSPSPRDPGNEGFVVSSVFPEGRRSPVQRHARELLETNEDLRPTIPYLPQPPFQEDDGDTEVSARRPTGASSTAATSVERNDVPQGAARGNEPVVLLTKRKKKD